MQEGEKLHFHCFIRKNNLFFGLFFFLQMITVFCQEQTHDNATTISCLPDWDAVLRLPPLF